MLGKSACIAIIGAGECGVRAAFELRNKGFAGSIELFSEEAHLPYERPPLSKHLPVEPTLIRKPEAYEEALINLHLGKRISGIDVQTGTLSMVDGGEVAYSALLMATGARARLLPGMEKALTLRTLDDARAILGRLTPDTRLVIIGGGFIGLELAATAASHGAQVTLLEAGDRLMARAVPASLSDHVKARHENAGVRILCKVTISCVESDSVSCTDGTVHEADIVVAGVGAIPNLELAESAGLRVANGIVVDDRFRTSASNVYAAGDCCAIPHLGQALRQESWRAAQEQGAHAAASMLGEVAAYRCAPWFWSDQYDLGLQVAGFPPNGGASVTRRVGNQAGFIECLFDEAGWLRCAAGIGPGNSVARDMRLLEKLIASDVKLSPAMLADETINLKQLLKAV